VAFFHGFVIRFYVESPAAFPWITHPDSVEYTILPALSLSTGYQRLKTDLWMKPVSRAEEN
jgi:hypothetical protein